MPREQNHPYDGCKLFGAGCVCIQHDGVLVCGGGSRAVAGPPRYYHNTSNKLLGHVLMDSLENKGVCLSPFQGHVQHQDLQFSLISTSENKRWPVAMPPNSIHPAGHLKAWGLCIRFPMGAAFPFPTYTFLANPVLDI